jgi:hypothetical protein
VFSVSCIDASPALSGAGQLDMHLVQVLKTVQLMVDREDIRIVRRGDIAVRRKMESLG